MNKVIANFAQTAGSGKWTKKKAAMIGDAIASHTRSEMKLENSQKGVYADRGVLVESMREAGVCEGEVGKLSQERGPDGERFDCDGNPAVAVKGADGKVRYYGMTTPRFEEAWAAAQVAVPKSATRQERDAYLAKLRVQKNQLKNMLGIGQKHKTEDEEAKPVARSIKVGTGIEGQADRLPLSCDNFVAGVCAELGCEPQDVVAYFSGLKVDGDLVEAVADAGKNVSANSAGVQAALELI